MSTLYRDEEVNLGTQENLYSTLGSGVLMIDWQQAVDSAIHLTGLSKTKDMRNAALGPREWVCIKKLCEVVLALEQGRMAKLRAEKKENSAAEDCAEPVAG